ncbi:MAG: hypothetical protein IPM97_03470 [Bdellovibrionaceae bacterium]|nr:hypothetical protein [Pseudobdellovibrionaceae bacterium]
MGKLFLYLMTLLSLITNAAFASVWKIDEKMKFNFAFLPSKIAKTEKASAKTILMNIPSYAPDITNIVYKSLLDLGFPIPPIEAPENHRFLIKLYSYPIELKGELSTHRALNPFYIALLPNGKSILKYGSDSKNLVVKHSVIDEVTHSEYTSKSPLPEFSLIKGSNQDKQNYFDGSIPYTTIYVKPEKSKRGLSERELAKYSADGVISFHQEILEAYRKLLVEIEPNEKNFRFLEAQVCPTSFDEICAVKLIEVAKAPLVFDNYKTLPMPHDPKKVFLTGLLLVKVSEFSIHIKIDNLELNLNTFLKTASLAHSQLLEVGSVLDLR